jgi:DNA-binding beta-propeller fold protein YncE
VWTPIRNREALPISSENHDSMVSHFERVRTTVVQSVKLANKLETGHAEALKTKSLGLADNFLHPIDCMTHVFAMPVSDPLIPAFRRSMNHLVMHRRAFLRGAVTTAGVVAAVGLEGCMAEPRARGEENAPELVWGVQGDYEGRLHRPRVAAIDASDHLYIADLTDRIQVFNRDGNYLRGWRTPGLNIDGPSGLTIDADGSVMVADTHFYRILIYDRHGNLLRQLGDGVQGSTPGRFGYPTDVVRDEAGNFYVCEYGEFDRIQVFDADGGFVRQWGGHGYETGQFLRPRSMAWTTAGHLAVADSCNHRIQVFDRDGKLVDCWGKRGSGFGEMSYPYDLAFAPDGTLFICEYGNSRVQQFSPDGKPLKLWGKPGRSRGSLNNPCALVVDSRGSVHVIDSGNHRVQRFRI